MSLGETVSLFEASELLAVLIGQRRRTRKLDHGTSQETAPEGNCNGDYYTNELSHGHTWDHP